MRAFDDNEWQVLCTAFIAAFKEGYSLFILIVSWGRTVLFEQSQTMWLAIKDAEFISILNIGVIVGKNNSF